VTKEQLRHDQGEELACMMLDEQAMAAELYGSSFDSPMLGLGVLQEEVYEMKKAMGALLKEYDSLQFYLCEHSNRAASDVATKMRLRAIELAKETIQVGAMCLKFTHSEVLW